jgi:opacity protein-like surface antigen
MKSKAVILVAALMLLGAGAASAGSSWLGFSGGTGFPTGDYGDAASTGWNVGATGTHMINDMWGIGGDLAYHSWGASDDLNTATEALFGPGSEINWSAFQATANATLNFQTQSSVMPYAKAGVGVYNVASKLSSPSGDDDASETKLGFNFGGGMNMTSSGNMRWGVNAAYHIIPAEDEFGADLNFFTVGLNVLWGLAR